MKEYKCKRCSYQNPSSDDVNEHLIKIHKAPIGSTIVNGKKIYYPIMTGRALEKEFKRGSK